LKGLSSWLESDVGDFMKEIADKHVDFAKNELNKYGIKIGGNLGNSIIAEKIDNNSAISSADGGHAIYVEFGTGIVGKDKPHKEANKFGITYDRNEHKEKGWIYPKDNRFYWTKGQPSKPFMYNAKLRLDRAIPKLVGQKAKQLLKKAGYK